MKRWAKQTAGEVANERGIPAKRIEYDADLEAQTEQCLRNIEAALQQAGSGLGDVVRVTYILPTGADFEACCTGNCERALYYAWESILNYEKSRGELKVNLMLNRTAPWADVDSYLPYSGRVEIKAKQPLTSVKVRAATWVDKQQVGCRVGGETRRISWNGSYLDAGSVNPGQTVTLEFPSAESAEIN